MIGPNELIAIAALTFTTLVSIAAAAYALGSLPKRNEFNQLRRDVSESHQGINDKLEASSKELNAKFEVLRQGVSDKVIASSKALNDKIDASNRDLNDKFNELRKDVNDKIDGLRRDVNESNVAMIAEIRRSHRQLMRALINHSHSERTGEPVFSEPADIELVAGDD